MNTNTNFETDNSSSITSLSKTERLSAMKKEAVNRIDLTNATQIGPFEWAVPVNGGYCSISITAKNPTGTEKVPAFNLEEAVEKFHQTMAERAEKNAERATKKKEKLEKKNSKTKEEE